MSEVGFEPTHTYVYQNTQKLSLESGALDRSAILTWRTILVFYYMLANKKLENC